MIADRFGGTAERPNAGTHAISTPHITATKSAGIGHLRSAEQRLRGDESVIPISTLKALWSDRRAPAGVRRRRQGRKSWSQSHRFFNPPENMGSQPDATVEHRIET